MRTVKQFILDTLLPYKEDVTNCALNSRNNGMCSYLNDEGKKCAVGAHMREGMWQNSMGGFKQLKSTFNPIMFLTEEAYNMNLSDDVWEKMQGYHDKVAMDFGKIKINLCVEDLERLTNLDFKELYF